MRRNSIAIALAGGLALASTGASALTLTSGAITITAESWEDFAGGYDPEIYDGDSGGLGVPSGVYQDGTPDLRGILNVTNISQLGSSQNFEPINQSLAKALGGESLVGILYGFDALYTTSDGLAVGSRFAFTGGKLDFYLDPTADESVASGVSGFGAGDSTYSTVSEAELYLSLEFAVANDTLSFAGPNTGATLAGTVTANAFFDNANCDAVTAGFVGGPCLALRSGTSGFLNVTGGSAAALFDTDGVTIPATSTTPQGTADFSFQNTVGTECFALEQEILEVDDDGNPTLLGPLVNYRHVDGCGQDPGVDPILGFPGIGFDDENGVTDPNNFGALNVGLWNTQDQGPAIGNVPEPGMLVLFGTGLLGLGWAGRRRRFS